MDLAEAVQRVATFEGGNLTNRLWFLEQGFGGLSKTEATQMCVTENLDPDLLIAASALKKVAGQINVVIHAVGILAALPAVLENGEVIQDLSLGAGNTGRPFDLETDRRIAEFKFIRWRGGAESIRQNSLFKDFYYLAEHETSKQRCIYLLGTSIPLKFLTGRRNLGSVMSKDARLGRDFRNHYGDRFSVVSEYHAFRRDRVALIDLLPSVPALGLVEDE